MKEGEGSEVSESHAAMKESIEYKQRLGRHANANRFSVYLALASLEDQGPGPFHV